MNKRDLSPIDQQWIQSYCDKFLEIATSLPEGPFKNAVTRRVECVMDLVESWQKRNEVKPLPEFKA